jgi:regulator of sirC expression with transglutaminase-like and TPR domain
MNDKELKALLSLLDDNDPEVLEHVEEKIISYGDSVIPYLEKEWEVNFNPQVQRRIEELIHTLQFDVLRAKLAAWYQDSEQDLLEGMWLISTYQYPDLSLEDVKKSLEQIYYEAWLEFKAEAHPLDQIKILNSVFFSKLKFGANAKNFHAPGNSMINVVLESKKGNPISLCIIYMLVAQRLKLPVNGVNLPNLFILTYKSQNTQFYINVFNRGLIFSKPDIDNYIAQLKLTPSEMFYQPCESPDIIRRVLRNLIISFEKLGEQYKVEEVKALLDVVGGE